MKRVQNLLILVFCIVFSVVLIVACYPDTVAEFTPTSEAYQLDDWQLFSVGDGTTSLPLTLVDTTRRRTFQLEEVDEEKCRTRLSGDKVCKQTIRFFASELPYLYIYTVYDDGPGMPLDYDTIIARFEDGTLVIRADESWVLQGSDDEGDE